MDNHRRSFIERGSKNDYETGHTRGRARDHRRKSEGLMRSETGGLPVRLKELDVREGEKPKSGEGFLREGENGV